MGYRWTLLIGSGNGIGRGICNRWPIDSKAVHHHFQDIQDRQVVHRPRCILTLIICLLVNSTIWVAVMDGIIILEDTIIITSYITIIPNRLALLVAPVLLCTVPECLLESTKGVLDLLGMDNIQQR
jgi:hypothetical protein